MGVDRNGGFMPCGMWVHPYQRKTMLFVLTQTITHHISTFYIHVIFLLSASTVYLQFGSIPPKKHYIFPILGSRFMNQISEITLSVFFFFGISSVIQLQLIIPI